MAYEIHEIEHVLQTILFAAELLDAKCTTEAHKTGKERAKERYERTTWPTHAYPFVLVVQKATFLMQDVVGRCPKSCFLPERGTCFPKIMKRNYEQRDTKS